MRVRALAKAGLVEVALAGLAGGPALAHSWYEGLQNEKGEACCGGTDCTPDLDLRDVVEVPGGFEIRSLGVTVPNARARPSKEDDGYYHICRWGGEVKCFFYPERGY